MGTPTGGILEWMRRMATAQMQPARPFAPVPGTVPAGGLAFGPPVAGPGVGPGVPAGPPAWQQRAGAWGQAMQPGFAGPLPQVPTPQIFQPPAAPQPIPVPGGIPGGLPGAAPPPAPQPTGIPTPETKTEPRAPLQFAWGGRTPQDYAPGVTDILQMAGAPPGGREGFMGVEPTDPSRPGGYVLPPMTPEGVTDWSQVAHPMGFEAFREAPMVQETLRGLEDPMWRERVASDIEQAREIAVGEALIQKQADVTAEAQRQMRLDIDTAYQDALQRAEAARSAAGQPPLTEDEKDDLWDEIQQRFLTPVEAQR